MTPTDKEKSDELIAALQARIRDLEDCLGLNDGNYGAIFRLPSSLARLLALLMAVPNVTPHMVQQRLEIVSDAKVAIHRLRQHMDTWCAGENIAEKIEIHSRRSLGYWLDSATKERIRALVTNTVTLRAADAA